MTREELLNRLGLEAYDVVDIVKITHGIMAEDFSWIKFEGENVSYEELFDLNAPPPNGASFN